jgi:hypothetical protein
MGFGRVWTTVPKGDMEAAAIADVCNACLATYGMLI